MLELAKKLFTEQKESQLLSELSLPLHPENIPELEPNPVEVIIVYFCINYYNGLSDFGSFIMRCKTIMMGHSPNFFVRSKIKMRFHEKSEVSSFTYVFLEMYIHHGNLK